MKRLRKLFSKWQVQLVLLLLPLGLGMAGYTAFYLREGRGLGSLYYALFSTVRLFLLNFDLTPQEPRLWVRTAVCAAQALALVATGGVLYRLLLPFFVRFAVKVRRSRWERRKDPVLILGNNGENLAICRSVPDKGRCVLLVRTLEECAALKAEQAVPAITANTAIPGNRSQVSLEDEEGLILRFLRKGLRSEGQRTLILNTGDEAVNLRYCRAAARWLRASLDRDREGLQLEREDLAALRPWADRLRRLRIYVFGDLDHQALYQDLQDASYGIIRFVNKYERAAEDFVAHHPFTEALDRAAFDRWVRHGRIAPELDFNFLLVGFGETNQALYTAATACFQYVTDGPGPVPAPKPVHYHIFDRNPAAGGLRLNHTVLRYETEFLEDLYQGRIRAEDYHPLPAPAAKRSFHPLDVNDPCFYREVREVCQRNPHSVNYLAVALGSDLENLDLALRLAEKKRDWGLDNLRIFVKVREGGALLRGLTGAEDFEPFGEEQALFRLDRLCQDDLEELALGLAALYEYERLRRQGKPCAPETSELRAILRWHLDMDRYKRASNRAAILSLRTKLQLLGLDLAPAGQRPREAGPVLGSNEDYFAIYGAEDRPAVAIPRSEAGEKDIYDYKALARLRDFTPDRPRRNLAVQEHCRWNAYMLSRGFVPETRENGVNRGPQNYAARRHANLTTFAGLFAFRREQAACTGTDEAAWDVVNYDFQLLDDAWWLLHGRGWELYQRWKDA